MNLLVLPYPVINEIAVDFGFISIRWYGLAYMFGLLLGWLYIRRLLNNAELWPQYKPAGAPIKAHQSDDMLIWVTLGVVIGGRLGFVLLYEPSYFIKNPLEVFFIWHGGMAFHGGLLGAGAALALFARRNKAPVLSIFDLAAAAVPIGLFFGRIANFINGEIFGRVTTVPWAMVFPEGGPDPRHPSQLYEAFLEGIVLFFILRLLTHRKGALATPGRVTGVFLIGYGCARIFVEYFKEYDPQQFFTLWPITAGMVYSVPMILLGLYFLRQAKTNIITSNDSKGATD